jgi:hypothetical protein
MQLGAVRMIRAFSVATCLALMMAGSATAAPPMERYCEIKPTKSICKLECAAKSSSQVCDEPFNTCRSTCGLFDGDKNPAVATLLYALAQRGAPSPIERLEQSRRLTAELLGLLRRFLDAANPTNTYVIVLVAIPGEGFKLRSIGPMLGEAVPSDRNELVIIIVLDDGTIAALQSSDPSVQSLVNQATELVAPRIRR